MDQLKSERPTYHAITWGSPNTLAEPAVEISQDEFIKLHLTDAYALCGVGHDQVYLDGKNWHTGGELWEIHYFWHLHYGLASASKFLGASKYEMRYFRIGCQHNMVEVSNPRMFEHHYECSKCGYTETNWSD